MKPTGPATEPLAKKPRIKQTRRLRELLAKDGLIQYPNVQDALSAKLVERAGFSTVGLGGYALGAAIGLAEPLYHLEDLVRMIRYVTAFVDIPLKVDAGAGFGEPLHVTRTIREIESAGAAACHIEDQIYPKRAHYHIGIEHVIPAKEMVAKIKVAIATRQDPDFVIIARSDSMHTDGYEEGIRRANMYLEAGADLVHVYPRTMEEAESAPKHIHGPVIHGVTPSNRKGRPVLTRTQLEDFNYKMASYPNAVLFHSVLGAAKVLKLIYEEGHTGEVEPYAEAREIIEGIIDLKKMYELERRTVEGDG